MIIILADSADPWSLLIHREASQRAEQVRWVEPHQVLDRVLLNWSVGRDGSVYDGVLSIDGCPVGFSDLTGVLVQSSLHLQLPLDDLSPEDRSYVTKETISAWLALLNALPCAVINRPFPGGRPGILSGEPLASLARKHGFLLPSALGLLNSADWTEPKDDLRSGPLYVKRLGSAEPGLILAATGEMERSAMATGWRAVSLQSVPDGQLLTVYVVDESAAGTVVHASPRSGGTVADLSAIAANCVALAGDLGIAFAECQIVVGSEGVYCLDVSSAPNFWRCPPDVRQRIVGLLADSLSQSRGMPLYDSLVGADRRHRSC